MAAGGNHRSGKPEGQGSGKPPANGTGGVSFLNLLGRFRRFFSDALGIFLIALAVMTLLAIFDLTGGSVLGVWSQNLRLSLGWGSILFVGVLAYSGYLLLNPRKRHLKEINWGRIMALEVAGFSFLILLAVIGGQSIDRAEVGLDGGVVGWGLAEFFTQLLGPVWWAVVVALVFVWSLAVGLGASGRFSRSARVWLRSQQAPRASDNLLQGSMEAGNGGAEA
ncbi:MAG TPA: hypothetical protein VJ768_06220, partial [Anaerolineales bacterium]|nr:hypothetical protein [Anaerolineales bacterium]